MKGFFITVEGGDGAGKTTQLRFIENWLGGQGVEVVNTREPGGTEVGEQIREMLLYAKDKMSDNTELLLMFAARMQNIEEIIIPAMENGNCVLCDRFTDATYAYQGGGRGIDDERIATIEHWAQGELQPDLTIVLDVPIETGIKRTKRRGDATDRFERENLVFKNAVRQAYIDRAARFPDRVKLIDASQSVEGVEQDIATELRVFYQKKVLERNQ